MKRNTRKSKKADGNMFWIVATAALVLLFVFVYFSVWKGLFGKGTGNIDNTIDNIDTDDDGVLNAKDKCPDKKGTMFNEGCPEAAT
jgi:hypothetical protein